MSRKYNLAQMNQLQFFEQFFRSASDMDVIVSQSVNQLLSGYDNLKAMLSYLADRMTSFAGSTRSTTPAPDVYHSVKDSAGKLSYLSAQQLGDAIVESINSGNSEVSFNIGSEIYTQDVEELLSDIAVQADLMALNAQALANSGASSYSDFVSGVSNSTEYASNLGSSVLDGVKQQLYNSASKVWSNGKTAVLQTICTFFGITNATIEQPDSDKLDVWNQITNRNVHEVLAGAIGKTAVSILVGAWHIVSTILSVLYRITVAIVRLAQNIIEGVVGWFQNIGYNMRSGDTLSTDGAYFGFSQNYGCAEVSSLRNQIFRRSWYGWWYLVHSKHINATPMTIQFLNVRFTLSIDTNLPSTILNDWSQFYSWINDAETGTPYYFNLVLQRTYRPVYAPGLCKVLREIINRSGSFTNSMFASNYTYGADLKYHYLSGDLQLDDYSIMLELFEAFRDIRTYVPSSIKGTMLGNMYSYGALWADKAMALPLGEYLYHNSWTPDEDEPLTANWLNTLSRGGPNGRCRFMEWCKVFLLQCNNWAYGDYGFSLGHWQQKTSNISYRHVRYHPYSTSPDGSGQSTVPGSEYDLVPLDVFDLQTSIGNITPDDYASEWTNDFYALMYSRGVTPYPYASVEVQSKFDWRNVRWGEDNPLAVPVRKLGYYGGWSNLMISEFFIDENIHHMGVIPNLVATIVELWNNYDYTGTLVPFVESQQLSWSGEYILSDDEADTAIANWISNSLIKIAVAGAVIAVSVYAIKLFKKWRAASFAADTAAFNAGDALVRGDTDAYNTNMAAYVKNNRVSKMLSIISPKNIVSAAAAGTSSVVSTVGSVARSVLGGDEGDTPPTLSDIKKLISG